MRLPLRRFGHGCLRGARWRGRARTHERGGFRSTGVPIRRAPSGRSHHRDWCYLLVDETAWLPAVSEPRVAVVAVGIDSVTRHPGMVVIGHHDREAMERLRHAAAQKNRVVRVVDQKTAVVPLHADTLTDPDKLVASLRSLLALAPAPSGRAPG